MLEDLGSKTKSSIIWTTLLKGFYQSYRFVLSIIIARMLDPEDYGIMSIATILVFYANGITSLGFNASLIQRKEINEKHINSVFTVNMTISLVLMIFLILMSNQIALFFNIPELRNVFLALSPIFILMVLFQMPVCLMKREVNFKTIAIVDFYRGFFQSSVTLILAFLGYKFWALVIGLITSYVVGLLYIYVKVKWKPRIQYHHGSMKEILNFGIWNFMRAQSININEYADRFIIGKFLGPQLLGFYDKAFSTLDMQKQAFTIHFNAVMFSSFSRIQSEKNRVIRKYLTKSINAISLITFPVNTGMFFLSTYFVLVLLGSKWEPMIVPLKILCAVFIFSTLSGLIASLNVGLGNYVKQTLRDGLCNIILIIVCLLAVQKGIEFVAIGILSIHVMIFILTFQLAKEKIEIRWMDLIRSILPALIGSMVMAFMLVICRDYIFHEKSFINLIVLICIGVVTYALAVFVPKYSMVEEIREILVNAIKKLCSKRKLMRLNRTKVK